MLHVLVYGDSLTWGIVPDTRRRLPFDARWPGVMEADLAAAGHQVRVIEDCLNIHLDAGQHATLGHALALRVAPVLGTSAGR